MYSSPFHYSRWVFAVLLLLVCSYVFIGDGHWSLIAWLFFAYSLVLFIGSYFIGLNFYTFSINKLPQVIVDFETDYVKQHEVKGKVCLTFDDGPQEASSSILDILKTHQVSAIFFVIGQNIDKNPAILKRMHEEGHQIGNHSFAHKPSFDWQNVTQMKAEIMATNHRIAAITGTTPYLFRPPFGVTNPNLAKAIKETNMTSVGWNMRSYDTIAKDEQALLNKILKGTKDGSIILLHDACAITAKILPKLITELRQRGYEFTTLKS